ncbi:hypothetical protein RRG08_054686 [Elysia crispata]|uniref:Tropomyosin n=1 Tax=Elysia crispata TaxID=231223 RepID=A0AAE1B2G1_9GAST|nr:hypothetical protein RRG08_054686 [Elysia crispata]
MEPIKKKMLSMKNEKESAIDKAEQLEQKLKETEEAKSKVEEEVNNLQKKLSKVENDFDTANEALQEATTKLEASEKQVAENFILRSPRSRLAELAKCADNTLHWLSWGKVSVCTPPTAADMNECDDVIMPYLECNARNLPHKPCGRGFRLCQALDCAPLH